MKKIILLSLLLLTACKNLPLDIEKVTPPVKSAKGDGYIFYEYLKYEKSLTKEDEKEIEILFSTKKDDVEKVNLVFAKKTYGMTSIGSTGEFEYFKIKVKATDKADFYFVVFDGNLKYYFGQNRSSKEKELIPFYYEKTSIEKPIEQSKLCYRVYIDSFYNGNKNNDPLFNEFGPESFVSPKGNLESGTAKSDLIEIWQNNEAKKILGDFNINKWNDDFNYKADWEEKADLIYPEYKGSTKRFGGDIKGLSDKLPYLKSYGIGTLWISSPFYSFSGSKNDIIDYRHISPDFGVIENKDKKSEYIQLAYKNSNENYLDETLDSNSWKNTESDEIFSAFVKEAKANGIGIISDITYDYVSDRFFAFEDLLVNGEESKYKSWFFVEKMGGEVVYEGNKVIGVESRDGVSYRQKFIKIDETYSVEDKQELLLWNKKNIEIKTVGNNKNLIELNLKDETLINYLIDASKKWVNLGIEGYVIRAKDKKNLDFYKKLEENLNNENKLSIIYDFETTQNDEFFKGKSLNYSLPELLQNFLGNNTIPYTGEELYTQLYILNRNRNSVNFIEGVDIERLNSSFINGNRDFDAQNEEQTSYLGIRPDLLDDKNIAKYKLGIFTQFILSGNSVIYYGSEKYQWGGDVPHNRKAMLWDEYYPYADATDAIAKYTSYETKLNDKVTYDEVEGVVKYKNVLNKEIDDFYKKLIDIRKNNLAYFDEGLMEKIQTTKDLVIFSKEYKNKMMIFIISKSSVNERVIIDTDKGNELVNLFDDKKIDILNRKAQIDIPAFGYMILIKK